MRSVPGLYGSSSKRYHKPVTLIDYGSIQAASLAAMENNASERSQRSQRTYIPTLPHSPQARFDTVNPQENPFRYMAIVRLPWFNSTLKNMDWGSHCLGCSELQNKKKYDDQKFDGSEWLRLFSETSFKDHMAQRGNIWFIEGDEEGDEYEEEWSEYQKHLYSHSYIHTKRLI